MTPPRRPLSRRQAAEAVDAALAGAATTPQMPVSGLHHNVLGGFLGLRVALPSAGAGDVGFRNFTYRGIPA